MNDGGLLERAESYLRTAKGALDAGDWPPAFENARTACELAAKGMLTHVGKATSGKQHNVARDVVEAGLWPGGDVGKRLSKFLGDHTRAVYGFAEPVTRADAERGYRIAEEMIRKAKTLD